MDRQLIAKLQHPLAEVRQRAVHSLRLKVDALLVKVDDLRLEPDLLQHLLQLVISESKALVRLDALAVIESLASASECSRQLVQLGAISELQKVQASGGDDGGTGISRAAERIVDKILHHPLSELPLRSLEQHSPTAAGAAAAVHSRPPPAAAVAVSRSLDFSSSNSSASTASASVTYAGEGRPRKPLADALLTLPCPPWMALRCVPLFRVDEQALFETAVRLQMSDTRVLTETCTHLGGVLCHDLPAAAVLRRPELYHSLFSLLRTAELADIGELALAALHTTSELVSQLIAALKGAADAPTRFPPISDPLSSSDCAHATSAGALASAPASAPGAGPAFKADGWEAWQVADAVWNAVTPLLRHPAAAPAAIPLLSRVLPLLFTPPSPTPSLASDNASPAFVNRDSMDEERIRQHAIVMWRGYLEASISVLRFHRLLPGGQPEAKLSDAAGEESDAAPPWRNLTSSHLQLILLGLSCAAACPSSFLVHAAPQGLVALLSRCVADPYLAICEAHAHNTARQCLRTIDPAAERFAAKTAAVEAALHSSRSISVPTDGLRSVLSALTRGGRATELRRQRAALGACLPALSYVYLPALPAAIVELARCSDVSSDDAVDAPDNGQSAIASALLSFVVHPIPTVREATLKHLLALFWRDSRSATPPDGSVALPNTDVALRAPLVAASADCSLDPAIEVRAAADLATLQADEDEQATAECGKQELFSSELASVVALLSTHRLLRVLVDTAMHAAPPMTPFASGSTPPTPTARAAATPAPLTSDEPISGELMAAGARLAQLAQALLLSLLPAMSDEQLRECVPLIPLLQAYLSPASAGAASREDEGDEVFETTSSSAALHAESCLSILQERLPTHVCLSARLRLLLHTDPRVCKTAARAICVDLGVAGTPTGVPDAPLSDLGATGTRGVSADKLSHNNYEIDQLLEIVHSESLQVRMR